MKKSPKSIIPWLTGRKALRIAVIGDVILDEYLDGQVNRISPEAPVPVHLVSKSSHGAGGAANAARNIKLAGGEPILFSVLGSDEAGRTLKDLLKKDKIDVSHLAVVNDRPTIRKTRVTEPQKTMENSFHQATNLDGAFAVDSWEGIAGPVLLVDDMVDSGWTFTVLAALLRQSGSGPVFPVALANTAKGS